MILILFYRVALAYRSFLIEIMLEFSFFRKWYQNCKRYDIPGASKEKRKDLNNSNKGRGEDTSWEEHRPGRCKGDRCSKEYLQKGASDFAEKTNLRMGRAGC